MVIEKQSYPTFFCVNILVCQGEFTRDAAILKTKKADGAYA